MMTEVRLPRHRGALNGGGVGGAGAGYIVRAGFLEGRLP